MEGDAGGAGLPASGTGLPARGADPARALSNGFLALVALTSALIVLGALVRAYGAGLACPDWPHCYGSWLPPALGRDFGVAIEVGHRALAACVGLSFLGLALLSLRFARKAGGGRRSICAGLAAGALLLVVQVILGGLTVLQGLAPWTVVAHLLGGNATNAAFFWTALALRRAGAGKRAGERPSGGEAGPARLGWALAVTALVVALVLQIGLGGTLAARGAGLACPAWPTCDGVAFFPTWRGAVGLHLAHRVVGYALLPTAAIAVWLAGPGGVRRGLATALFAIILLQIGVGIANVAGRLPVAVTAMHSGLAALLVLLLTAAVWETLTARAARGGAVAEGTPPARASQAESPPPPAD